MAKQGRVFVICGAAGSGKTTVARYLRTEFHLHRVITHTTRQPRPTERDGVDYHFETAQSMAKLHLLEAVTYDQARYGSSLEGLAEGWQQGQDDVIVLDTKGAATYYQRLGSRVTIIFLTVSKLASLAHRMAARGDARTAIDSRLHSLEYQRDLHLPAELRGIAQVVTNDDWVTTTKRLHQIMGKTVTNRR